MAETKIQKVLKTMDETIIKIYNEHTLPGLAVAIVQDGKLIYSKGFGLANIEQKKPIEMDTIFRIGSISKTFTAIGIMQLVEQGKLSLDDPVNKHLKTFKVEHKDPGAPPVTILHLLTHTSGIGEVRDLRDIFKPVGGLGAKMDDPLLPLSEYYQGVLRPEIFPGQKWAYANHAFNTLAQVIEDVSGQPFAVYMQEHVFAPLGMDKSDYLLSERVKADLAQGYSFKKGKFTPVPYQRIEVPGAGSIHSSVNQMLKYVTALMNGGANETGRVLKPETLEKMFTSQLDIDSPEMAMGLAFILYKYGSHRVVFHNGGWPGFISSMLVAPEDKLAVLAFTNTDDGVPDVITAKIMRQLLDVPEPVSQVPLPGVLETPHEWSKLCGFYGPKPGFLTNLRLWMGFGGEMEIFVKGNHLAVRSLVGPLAKGVELVRGDAKNPWIFKGKQGENVMTLVFKVNENGKVIRLTAGTSELYKHPLQQSVKFRVLTIFGALTGALLFVLGRGMCKKCCRKHCGNECCRKCSCGKKGCCGKNCACHNKNCRK